MLPIPRRMHHGQSFQLPNTKPDKPGHSNENKLQLKVGELALLKHTRPELRLVLAIGGTGDAWLPYVLKAFKILYDEVVYLWPLDGANRLAYIADNPSDVPLRHTDFWESLRAAWRSRQTTPEGTEPPFGLVRYRIADILRNQNRIVHDPSLIENEVARLCLQRSKDSERCCMDRGGDGIRPFPSGSVRRCVRTQAARVRSLCSELSGRPGSPRSAWRSCGI